MMIYKIALFWWTHFDVERFEYRHPETPRRREL